MAASATLPLSGRVFISVNERDKAKVVDLAKSYIDLGFEIISTSGTAKVLIHAGLKVERLNKISEGRPNALDLLKNREIQLVVNTPSGQIPRSDEVKIRTTAVYTQTPIMTTLGSAWAASRGIAAIKKYGYSVKPLQAYHGLT
jgi:carbamoyl-phosphate synthase large subunit